MAPKRTLPPPPPQRAKRPKIVGKASSSDIVRDINTFMESWKQERFLEITSAVEAVAIAQGNNNSGKKVKVNLPASALQAGGKAAERSLMQALGWYWEPLLHDLAFFEEMRDSVPIIDGSVQKLVDVALDGFKLQCEDPDVQQELEMALLDDPNVDLRETFRNAMIDLYSLGNCYKVPIWTTNENGRKVPKVFRPIRANALRKLRDEDLYLEGFVQLLHRPSEFIMGVPSIPTLYTTDQVLWGIMRSYGWYAYGRPALSSLPFMTRLKLTMERDLAEMLHQHVPRINITFTPDDQMSQEQVDSALADTASDVGKLRSTDNYVHTPDVTFEYAGPENKGLDFQAPQKHIEEQLFYVLPFAPAIMGRDSQANPFDSQQHWTLATMIAESLRTAVVRMFKPCLNTLAQAWGIEGGITVAWGELDPTKQQQMGEAEELNINNAALNRDNGFLDQDHAAKRATSFHKDGGVSKAAAPGKLPPPIDPNKPDPAAPGAGKTVVDKTKNRDKGPNKDGTKAPQSDKRPKGRRHDKNSAFADLRDAALEALSA